MAPSRAAGGEDGARSFQAFEFRLYSQVSPARPLPLRPPNRIMRSGEGEYAAAWPLRALGPPPEPRLTHFRRFRSKLQRSASAEGVAPPNMIMRSDCES